MRMASYLSRFSDKPFTTREPRMNGLEAVRQRRESSLVQLYVVSIQYCEGLTPKHAMTLAIDTYTEKLKRQRILEERQTREHV